MAGSHNLFSLMDEKKKNDYFIICDTVHAIKSTHGGILRYTIFPPINLSQN